MPELKIVRPDGTLLDEAFPIVASTMHLPLPGQADARQRLCDHKRIPAILEPFYDGYYDEFQRGVLDSQLLMLRRGRKLEELVPDVSKHYRDTFIAAHWLLFRLFAAQNRPRLNSNSRWLDYASAYLMPNLPNGTDWKWTINQKTLRIAVRNYGRVAHLWAAVTYSDSFRRLLLTRPDSICENFTFLWPVVSRVSQQRVFRQAKGYYQAAVAAGIYNKSHEEALVRPDDVWTLPDSIEAEAPTVDHPDHLISVDFDQVEREYVPRSEASAEARGEQQKHMKVELRAPVVPV
jgi:hypothetical protein